MSAGLEASGCLSPGLYRAGLPGTLRSDARETEVEIHRPEIPGRQQSQGQDLIARDRFPLGVIVDQAQIFHGLAPLGQESGIQDQAVVRRGLGPLQLPPQIGEKAPVKRPPTPFGLLKAIEGVLLGLNQGLERSVQQVMDGLDMHKNQIGQDKQEVYRGTAFPFTDTRSGEMRFDVQHGKQFLDP